MLSNIFETLTTIGPSGAPEPRLAEEMWALDGGRRFRFRLRDVRFHDGRKLTTRDVRYSLLRVLRQSPVDFALLDLPIVGSAQLRARESDELPGFRAISDRELEFVLEEPLPFFPALLSHPLTAIVPEDCRRFDLSWRDGCAGTGPFRLIACEAGRRIEMAANPSYWRPGLPRVERLVFHLATDPATLAEDLRRGVYHAAGGLSPAELASFARDSRFAAGLGPAVEPQHPFRGARRPPRSARRARPPAGGGGGAAQGAARPGPAARGGRGGRRDPAAACAARRRRPGPARGDQRPQPRPAARRARAGGRPAQPDGGSAPAALEPPGAGPRAGRRQAASGFQAAPREMLQAVSTGEADLALVVWTAPYPDADGFASMFEPKAGLLGKAVVDPRIDALRARARTENDPEERRRLYLELEERLRLRRPGGAPRPRAGLLAGPPRSPRPAPPFRLAAGRLGRDQRRLRRLRIAPPWCTFATEERSMAKAIVVEHEGAVSSFAFNKIDRSRLYGRRRRVALDPAARPCTRAALTDDGALLLRSGMTAQG